MTNFSKNTATKSRKASRFSMLALALSLSAGTVAGMLSIAALTSGPAQAQSAGNGGNGGNGGGGPAGGAGGGANPMSISKFPNNPSFDIDRQRPNRNPNFQVRRAVPPVCEGNVSQFDAEKCKINQRSAPRIVRINGFAQCAVIQQVPNPNGGPADFFCLKTM